MSENLINPTTPIYQYDYDDEYSPQRVKSLQFDNYDFEPSNELYQIHIPHQNQNNTINTTEYIEPNSKVFKNAPKQIGNNFCNFIQKRKNTEEVKASKSISKFIQKRRNEKQSNITINQIQELCLEKNAQNLFSDFIQNHHFLYLIHSNKVDCPKDHILSISNFYASSQCPEKMKGNFQIQNTGNL